MQCARAYTLFSILGNSVPVFTVCLWPVNHLNVMTVALMLSCENMHNRPLPWQVSTSFYSTKEQEILEAKQSALYARAQGVFKNVGFMCFMMWMSGSQIHLFSIMMTVSGIYQPLMAIMNSRQSALICLRPCVCNVFPVASCMHLCHSDDTAGHEQGAFVVSMIARHLASLRQQPTYMFLCNTTTCAVLSLLLSGVGSVVNGLSRVLYAMLHG